MERTPPSISLISGTENVVLSCPPLGALWRIYTSRFSSRLTSGFSSTPRTSVKMAALAPIPSASVRITIPARLLLCINEWNASLKSRKNEKRIFAPWRRRADRLPGLHHIVEWLHRNSTSRRDYLFQLPNPLLSGCLKSMATTDSQDSPHVDQPPQPPRLGCRDGPAFALRSPSGA